VRWFLDSKPDRNIPLWSQIWKGNMLQNTQLQGNGRQSPKSDDDMNDWCVKTRQNREGSWFFGTNLQISRHLRQKIMMYCRIHLQTSKALRNTNLLLNGSKMGKSWGPAKWFSLCFTRDHENFETCGVFQCKSRTMGPFKTFGKKGIIFSIALNIDRFGWKFRLFIKSAVSQLFH